MSIDELPLCQLCHAAVTEPHPEEKYKILNWRKCPICGWAKQYIKKDNPLDKIINGRPKKNIT